MPRPLRRVVAVLLLIAFCARACADDAARESAFRDSLLPLLRTYCFDCHEADSEIPLENADSVAYLQNDRKTYRHLKLPDSTRIG